jgi:uncharacterized OsmC-like protein
MNVANSESRHFAVSLARHHGFQFLVDFRERDVPALTVDEPPPLGEARGPNPTRLLAAAVGDCLSASLLYCLERARIPVTDFDATVEGELVRNERGRLRIAGIKVKLMPRLGGDASRAQRCRELFEDFCVVTQSVREGIDVQVEVEPIPALETAAVPD